VSRNGARWFTASVSSTPSALTARRAGLTPALLTRTCTAGWRATISSAARRIDASDARSTTTTDTSALPLARATSARAASPSRASRASITTVAPSRASAVAVALPMPRFAPVTTQTRPRSRSGGHTRSPLAPRPAAP
jgi:hypothetical protein